MTVSFSTAGAADAELARETHDAWVEAARGSRLELDGFDLDAALDERLRWATLHKWEIGTILSRYSSKMQHSTSAQVRDCAQFAARNRIYVPPEFICVDEAVSGRKSHRNGLDRVRAILEQRAAKVLLVFKVSRLFRVAYLGFKFFQEDVIEEGLRAISISQGIDTNDEKAWKPLAYLHGVMDEMLIGTIGDHVRTGLKDLFLKGYTTGALTVGYKAVDLPGAPPTNRGLPRKVPIVDPDVAPLIRQHFEWIREGMPLREGWRRWVQAGGPHDRRSTSGHLTYNAYRGLLSNSRLTGVWAFGRKRNVWSSKRDYTRQLPQPDTDVAVVRYEELRIVDDALFYAVQARLAQLKIGPRGPKKPRTLHLWDLVTDCFYCAHCRVRFYQGGAHGKSMICKRGDLCPCKSLIRREDSVRAVCEALVELIRHDEELVEGVIGRAQPLDAVGDGAIRTEIDRLENAIGRLSRKSDDLLELLGEGTDADRASLKLKIRAVNAERASLQAEQATLKERLARAADPITPDRVREFLGSLGQLLEDGASGKLGADVVYRASEVFRMLVGERIWVSVEARPGRTRSIARGTFRPDLIRSIRSKFGDTQGDGTAEPPEVVVWLRRPPQKDVLAERVHELMDIQGLSYREAAAALQAEGRKINSGVVWQIYQRYYEIINQPVPERPYNNGRPRRTANRPIG